MSTVNQVPSPAPVIPAPTSVTIGSVFTSLVNFFGPAVNSQFGTINATELFRITMTTIASSGFSLLAVATAVQGDQGQIFQPGSLAGILATSGLTALVSALHRVNQGATPAPPLPVLPPVNQG